MSDVFPVKGNLSRVERSALLKQQPLVVWLTGLSGSGKSTLAYLLEKELLSRRYVCMVLDGDNLRSGLNKDLGFSEHDRRENIRRAGEICKLITDAGIIVIASFISPCKADRNKVRELVSPGAFCEVYLNASLNTCETRDPKGLYKKARAGVITDFTGIHSPYEAPESPDLEIHTDILTETESLKTLASYVFQTIAISK